LEVAQVQIEIYGALVSSEDLDDGAKHQVLERLGMGLYTISDVSLTIYLLRGRRH
jgi:hypothetical protein